MQNRLGTIRLETERLVLDKITGKDAKDLLEIYSDPRVTDNDGGTSINNIDIISRVIHDKWTINYLLDRSFYLWGIFLKDTGKLIGHTSKVYDEFGVGISLNHDYWGKGYAQEALSEVVRYLLDEEKFTSLTAYHMVHNESSGRVLSKCGFVFEGEELKINASGENCRVRKYVINGKNL